MHPDHGTQLVRRIQKAKEATQRDQGLSAEETPPQPPLPHGKAMLDASSVPELDLGAPPPPPPLPPDLPPLPPSSVEQLIPSEPYDPFAATEQNRSGPDPRRAQQAAGGRRSAGSTTPLRCLSHAPVSDCEQYVSFQLE